jgi:predicted ATPase
VLDNFEHLVEEGAPIVQTLLERAPTLTCLATSRRLLNLSYERELALSPLPVEVIGGPGSMVPANPSKPTTDHRPRTTDHLLPCASVQLFVDRAQTARPDFQLTEQNAVAVVELCARLEGIPLAIELAASRARTLTAAQMLTQMQQRRFGFLVSRKRDVAARHQTLRSAVDWSYCLLAEELREFFARLSVFRGGWTLEAAEAVCEAGTPEGAGPDSGQALEYLEQLREWSLVQAEETEQGMRFRMLETLREYAQERLEDQRETSYWRDRHLRFYHALAEREREQSEWLAVCETELSNIRTALSWAVEADSELGLGMASRMRMYWSRRGPSREGRELFQRLLATPIAQGSTLARARVLEATAMLAWMDDRYFETKSLYEACLKIFNEHEDSFEACEALGNSGEVAFYMGDYETALRVVDQWAERAVRMGFNISGPLYLKACVAGAQGNYYAAAHLCEQSRAVMQNEGYDNVYVCQDHGLFLARTGDLRAGRAVIEYGLALARKAMDRRGEILGLTYLSIVASLQSEQRDSLRYIREALTLQRDAGMSRFRQVMLRQVARIEAAAGCNERAATLFSAAYALCESSGQVVHPDQREEDDVCLSELRLSMGDRFAAAWEEGRAMTSEEAVAYALEADA